MGGRDGAPRSPPPCGESTVMFGASDQRVGGSQEQLRRRLRSTQMGANRQHSVFAWAPVPWRSLFRRERGGGLYPHEPFPENQIWVWGATGGWSWIRENSGTEADGLRPGGGHTSPGRLVGVGCRLLLPTLPASAFACTSPRAPSPRALVAGWLPHPCPRTSLSGKHASLMSSQWAGRP